MELLRDPQSSDVVLCDQLDDVRIDHWPHETEDHELPDFLFEVHPAH